MLIAIDYDDTVTRDVAFWQKFCLAAAKRGHTVICVTARSPEYRREVEYDLGGFVEDIVFTSGKAKRRAAYEHGYMNVSVWIDDQPGWIDNDAIAQ